MKNNAQVISLDSLTQVIAKNLELILYAFAFVFPLVLHGQQLLVGPIINALLFFAARKLSYKKLLPLVILPSLAAVTRGVVVGPLTMFLVYLLPFIWLSNLILIFVVKKLKDKSLVLRVGLSSVLKAVFLFSVTWIMFQANMLPKILLTAMGVLQLSTAVAGGVLEEFLSIKFKMTGEE
ncbi:MAG: hypothetical protein ABFQ62_02980 [Patescibacteria group bacterium]